MSDRNPAIARSTVVCRPRRGLGFTRRVIPSISPPLGLTPPGYELPPLRGWQIPSISPPLGLTPPGYELPPLRGWQTRARLIRDPWEIATLLSGAEGAEKEGATGGCPCWISQIECATLIGLGPRGACWSVVE